MPRLTSKGQVTVPVAVRYALGLAPGDDVVFAVEGDRGVFRRATALDALRARFPSPPARLDDQPSQELAAKIGWVQAFAPGSHGPNICSVV